VSLDPLHEQIAQVFADRFGATFRLCYFLLSRPETSWCTTCSQAGEGAVTGCGTCAT
jgi:hypothetical protein